MPKLKTHSGASKRFKMTKSGKVKRAHANRRHLLNGKTTKVKRALRKATYVCDANSATIKKLMPYS